MKYYSYIQITIILITSYFLFFGQTSATVINIPADYPTIQQGIDASVDGDTVLVQPGTYYENINFNGHNIVLGSLFLTTADHFYKMITKIDGEYSGGIVITFENGENNSAVITGFTIRKGKWGIKCINSSPIVHDNIITNNVDTTSVGDAEGGGIICENSGVVIESNYIIYNGAESYDFNPNMVFGYGILGYSSDLIIRNNIIRRIFAHTSYWNEAYGIYAGSGTTIINNIITEINAGPTIWDYAYGLSCPSCPVTNCIIRNNKINVRTSTTDIEYSNIQGGWPGEGNINLDPLFRDPDNGDFHLMSTACGYPYDSPCIDAGSPYYSDSLLDCSWGLGTTASDMGAYGGGDTAFVGISNSPSPLPERYLLLQNFPNPFNAQTTIRFILLKPGIAELAIYDLLGRQIEVLIDEYREPGVHSITYDASALSSGVYFYRLRAGDAVETKRMVLLK